jgi:hypothetical protein
MSARLVAAGRVRQLAFAGANELETSRALLAELSELLRTYYQRRLVDVAGERVETTHRVGPTELRAWWGRHEAGLVAAHRDMAEAFVAPLWGA